MISGLDIRLFYKLVENKYTFVHDSCEIEQTLDAMRSYVQYPLYEEWEIAKHDYANGSWKLIYNNEVLTADIITSIGRAIRKYLKKHIREKIGNFRGIHIVNAIVDNPYLHICIGGGPKKKLIFDEKIDLCEIRAFVLVVYWIGNMMPVSKNPSTGRGGENDDWHYKMQYILDIIYGKEHTNHQWDEWIKKWSDKNKAEKFIKGNYLQDMFLIGADDEYKVKDDNENNWFINNTKLIIQRSYRIVHNYNGSWNENSFKPVKDIIKTIFLTAKIPEEKAEEHCKTWF